jgi:hypothetical protein
MVTNEQDKDGSFNESVSLEYVKARLDINTEKFQCPQCDLQSGNLNWFEFRTSNASWRHLAGRQGFIQNVLFVM